MSTATFLRRYLVTDNHISPQAWPFAFQHGGSLSCSISQRWNVNPQSSDALSCRNLISRDNTQNIPENNSNYVEDYSENDYEERYEENNTQAQYYNYGYKENYYEMRNSYSSEDLLNNV